MKGSATEHSRSSVNAGVNLSDDDNVVKEVGTLDPAKTENGM